MVIDKRIVCLLATLVLALGICSACAGAPVEPAPAEEEAGAPTLDGALLFQQRCTGCHSAERTTGTTKSRAQWEQTVDRMIGRGAQLNDAERAVVIDYLAETYGP